MLTQSNWLSDTFLPTVRLIPAFVFRIGSRALQAFHGAAVPLWHAARYLWLQLFDVIWSASAAPRCKSFRAFAEQFELLFEEDGQQLSHECFMRFPLFQMSDGGTIRYHLNGEFINARVKIFDYHPCTAGFQWHTVVAFRIVDCRVPAFALWPRQFMG